MEATEFARRRSLPGVSVRRMFGKRYTTIELSLGGKVIATMDQILKRDKVVSVTFHFCEMEE